MYKSTGWPSRHQHLRIEGFTVPASSSELLATYGQALQPALQGTGKGLDQLVEALGPVYSEFNPREHLPSMLTAQEVYNFLGATYGMWCGLMSRRARKGFCPTPVSGAPTSRTAVFRTEDILRIQGERGRWPVASTYPLHTAQEFESFLMVKVDQVVSTWPKVKVVKKAAPLAPVGWPIGVPKNYTELYKEYRTFVEKILNRYYRPMYSQPVEDVRQHIWEKIIASKCIEKFVQKAKFRKLPAKLTAEEAVEFLGISWDCWFELMRRDLKWLQPEEGEAFSVRAVFSKVQIRNVEESGYVPIKDAIPAEDMSKVFRGYMTQVIHNHFANYVRTMKRRFNQDQVVPEDARVVGGHLGRALEGDTTSWEDNLEDPNAWSPDAGLDASMVECGQFSGAKGLDGMESVFEDLSEQIERVSRAVGGRQNDVYSLVADGMTLREAIAKVRGEIRTERLSVAVG